MPEGDTIHRTAATLHRALGGRIVSAVDGHAEAADPSLVDLRVEDVVARGKHLLIRFDDGRALHTHCGMTGSWHVYRPGERWRKPPRRATVVLHTSEWVAVCFSAPVARLVDAAIDVRRLVPGGLGPDLTDGDADLEEATRRLTASPAIPLGVALLQQSRVAGIGNVYKSEVLFLRGLDPFATTETLDAAATRALVETAARLLQANLRGTARVTRIDAPGERLWVYGRSGRPCHRCQTLIAMRRQGLHGRSTYYCPTCQGVP